jgi:hypothetical protein
MPSDAERHTPISAGMAGLRHKQRHKTSQSSRTEHRAIPFRKLGMKARKGRAFDTKLQIGVGTSEARQRPRFAMASRRRAPHALAIPVQHPVRFLGSHARRGVPGGGSSDPLAWPAKSQVLIFCDVGSQNFRLVDSSLSSTTHPKLGPTKLNARVALLSRTENSLVQFSDFAEAWIPDPASVSASG